MKTLEMRENHRKMGDIYKTTPISAAINLKISKLGKPQQFCFILLFGKQII